MKPIDRIIELAKRLDELDLIHEIQYGDWYLLAGKPILCAYSNDGFRKWAEASEVTDIIPIPSLDSGLEWLRGQGFSVYLKSYNNGWTCELLRYYEMNLMMKQEDDAENKWEVVLMAMVKVLEIKKEGQ